MGKQITVTIKLDLTAETDGDGKVDKKAVKECVYSYLSELIDDDSLSYEVASK